MSAKIGLGKKKEKKNITIITIDKVALTLHIKKSDAGKIRILYMLLYLLFVEVLQSDRRNISWNHNLFIRSYIDRKRNMWNGFYFCCYLLLLPLRYHCRCCSVRSTKTFPPIIISFLFRFCLLTFHFTVEFSVMPTHIQNILICTICTQRRYSRPIMLKCDVRTLKPICIGTGNMSMCVLVYYINTLHLMLFHTLHTHSPCHNHINGSQCWRWIRRRRLADTKSF